jgi:CelD/BcsL family acetyltransferase involved in cellulose biosynthesis
MGVKSTCEHRVPVGASLLPIDELTAGDLDAWRELAEGAAEPNPFFHPAFAIPMAKALGPPGLSLLVVSDESGWRACLPVERKRGWHRVPLRGLVCWRHPYCFLGTPLARAEGLDAAISELVAEGMRHAGGFLGLDLVGTGGPVSAALEGAVAEQGLRSVVLERFERAALTRREDGSYLALSAKHRRNFERLRRRLEDDLGGTLELRDRTSDPKSLREFLDVEASGWKGGEGTGTALDTIGHGDLFVEAFSALEGRGMVQMVAAEAAGRTVAMLCSLIDGGTVFTFKIAAAADLLAFSPGVQIEILYLDRFHADQRLTRADSCAAPGHAMIDRLWPDRREIEIRAVAQGGFRGLGAASILHGADWARSKLKR